MRIASVESEVASRIGVVVGVPFRPTSGGEWHLLGMRAADLSSAWRSLSLARRFFVVALLALASVTAVSGIWVSDRVERGVVQSRVHSATALLLGFVGPLVQALATGDSLPLNVTAAFDKLLSASAVADQVHVLRIRRPNGELVYSSDRADGSTSAPVATELDTALSGDFTVELNDVQNEHSALEQRFRVKLFEINAPLYKTGTREVIAVAQLYGVAEALHADLRRARAQSWLSMAVLTLAMMAALFKLVQNASDQIEQQRRVIGEQKAEEARLVLQNEALRKLADLAHRRGIEHIERFLRRIGSDLHDGPAQHLALVLLRLDELAPLLDKLVESAPNSSRGTLETIRRATSDAMTEIRNISGGLALPELQKISLADALLIAVRTHQRATGTRVETKFGSMPARLPLPMTICLYRFAQEALNNAFRHAGGKGQRLNASYDGGTITVEIVDSGPGFIVDHPATGGERLGLLGLRYRVESLGGSLQINSAIGQGAKLTVQFRNPLA